MGFHPVMKVFLFFLFQVLNGSDLHFRRILERSLIAVWKVDLKGWVKREAGGDGGLNLGRNHQDGRRQWP